MTALQYFIYTMGIDFSPDELTEFMNKEKQQIIDAYKEGAVYGMNVNGGCEWDEYEEEQTKDYYNEKYNTK